MNDWSVVFEGARTTILLVESEQRALGISRKILENLGCRVLAAADSAEALKVYRERKSEIDLVILDVIIPELGGVTACNQLRQVDPSAKVLVVTGAHNGKSGWPELVAGANAILTKPYKVAELARALRLLIGEPGRANSVSPALVVN